MRMEADSVNQTAIGKFIAERRKARNLTQLQLAEMLGITDRAVSKWETGKSMPDASIMLELCGILKISVNDLLCGEAVSMDKYNEKAEELLLEMAERKEEADRRILSVETALGIISALFMFAMVFTASFVDMPTWLRIALIAIGFIVLFVGCFFALRIEQMAGYYECQKFGNRYIPEYKSVCFAMHTGRTRYMKCPKCGEKSWQKKVLKSEH